MRFPAKISSDRVVHRNFLEGGGAVFPKIFKILPTFLKVDQLSFSELSQTNLRTLLCEKKFLLQETGQKRRF